MKNKKLIITLIALFIGIIGATSAAISAWLTDTQTTDETVFTVGDVTYNWSGALTTDTPIVPGQELVATGFALTNASTVTSELRVAITITSSLLEGDATELVLMTIGAGWVDGEDGYWYYTPSSNPVIPASGQVISILTSLKLDGSKVGNAHSGETFTISLSFQAKQAQYVTWTELGTANIDFSTGLAGA